MDDLVLREDGVVEYRWTFTGTSAETGKSVRVPGFRGVDDRPGRTDRRVTRSL